MTSLAAGPWARYAATERVATAEAPMRRLVLLVDATEDTRDLYGDWFFIRGFDVVDDGTRRYCPLDREGLSTRISS